MKLLLWLHKIIYDKKKKKRKEFCDILRDELQHYGGLLLKLLVDLAV